MPSLLTPTPIYPILGNVRQGLTSGQLTDLAVSLKKRSTRTRKQTTMTPTTNNTATVQMTVFDLDKFDDVKLEKTINLPPAPATLEDALAAAGNDSAKLLKLIHDGMIAEAKETAKASIDGFVIVGEDGEGETETPYTGTFADEEKGKLINGAILAFAKMQGYVKSLSKEKKRELKENAKSFLRANPAMLANIKG